MNQIDKQTCDNQMFIFKYNFYSLITGELPAGKSTAECSNPEQLLLLSLPKFFSGIYNS